MSNVYANVVFGLSTIRKLVKVTGTAHREQKTNTNHSERTTSLLAAICSTNSERSLTRVVVMHVKHQFT
jgi:CII-binding regulator of phage lambda lysogenization HflD